MTLLPLKQCLLDSSPKLEHHMNMQENETHAPTSDDKAVHARKGQNAATRHMSHRRSATPPTFQVKSLVIGSDKPKIVVPITAEGHDDAVSMAQAIGRNPAADLAEFRIDFLKGKWSADCIADLCEHVGAALDNKPLLVTFRTLEEGGQRTISLADYESIYNAVLIKQSTDLIDLQMMIDRPCLARLTALAHKHRIGVIMSNHNFHETPPTAVLVARLRAQQEMGADILKIAAMPQNAGDTLRLMAATWEMFSQYAHRPLLSMSMGAMGVVSRLAGELTGSSLSYGSIGASSAPGQLKAEDLHRALSIIHVANAD